ncbi:hypothetical protein [Leifsonia sp. Le1]|uniref:hypothetical protein n=1 Tax=Leifsonia sp. Le1 TaxID=3404918 RepID=UPI003EB9A280
MDATWLRSPEEPTWDRGGPTVYRVRLWAPAPGPYTGWNLDDWAVTGATDVTEVIAWAEQEAARLRGGRCEVFVQATEHGTLRDGTLAEQVHHIRVYGEPADTAATETVLTFRTE